MSRIGLSIVLALVLSGCQGFNVPVAPSLPVTDADFSGALAGPPTGGPLGMTPTLSGNVARWPISGARPVSLDWPQKLMVGTIDGGGNYNVALPARLPAAPYTTLSSMSLQQLVRKFNIFAYADCSVDTLVVSAPDAVAAELTGFYVARNSADAGAPLQPQFTPAPPYNIFKPFTQYFNATEMVLYSSVAATAKGELSCTSPYLSGSRYHLFVHIALAPGWNAATLIYGEERKVGGETVQKMLLKGGLGRSGLNTGNAAP
jgi:hypothetical protein